MAEHVTRHFVSSLSFQLAPTFLPPKEILQSNVTLSRLFDGTIPSTQDFPTEPWIETAPAPACQPESATSGEVEMSSCRSERRQLQILADLAPGFKGRGCLDYCVRI